MQPVIDYIRRKPRTTALMALGIAGFAGYGVFIAEDTTALWTWAPLALCLLMHGFMHGGHGHKHGHGSAENTPEETPQPAPVRQRTEGE